MANICTHVSGKDHSNRNKKMLCTINHQTLLFHGPYPMEKHCTRRYPLCSQRKVHSSHWILSSVGFSVDKAVCSVSKPWAVCSAPSMKTTVHENHRSHCNTHLEGVTLMEMAWGSKGQGSWHKRLTPRCWETVSMGGVKQDINWVGKCVCVVCVSCVYLLYFSDGVLCFLTKLWLQLLIHFLMAAMCYEGGVIKYILEGIWMQHCIHCGVNQGSDTLISLSEIQDRAIYGQTRYLQGKKCWKSSTL